MNLPNTITVVRIAMVPLYLLLSFLGGFGFDIAALAVFVVASGSDFIDGYVARRMGTVSGLGESLDPAADKLLVGAALVVLVVLRPFPLWAAIVIAVREIAVTWLRARVVATGATLPASPVAKAKTVVQMAMVAWWMVPWDALNPGHWLLLGLALVVTVWSGAEYFRKALQVQAVPL